MWIISIGTIFNRIQHKKRVKVLRWIVLKAPLRALDSGAAGFRKRQAVDWSVFTVVKRGCLESKL